MASHGTCNSGHVSPCSECGVTDAPICSGRQVVTAKLKVAVDLTVCG
jgi:hypothetical protein